MIDEDDDWSVSTPSSGEDEGPSRQISAAAPRPRAPSVVLSSTTQPLETFNGHVPGTPIVRRLPGSHTMVLAFQPQLDLHVWRNADLPVGSCALAYKMIKCDPVLIKAVLGNHGFRELHPSHSDFNILWGSRHLTPHDFRTLLPHQKANHFPRSQELTRKDRLYCNIHRMQQLHGFRHFNIAPKTFILPGEFADFQAQWAADKSERWIVKPVASSQGKGIYLVNHPNQVALDEPLVLSRYIGNPLLVDGYKFDLRLYVAVTSYDPLRIYMYEEGLARFATVKFDTSSRNMKDSFMHLTNYSVNKASARYVSCSDDQIEDFGNKWSFGALLQHLADSGQDIVTLMANMESLIVKTVIAGELPIATATKTMVPFDNTCIELYGFDVLVDAALRPWLVEVNLSPSMACDAPLDLKIKGHLIPDLFSLAMIPAVDPVLAHRQHRANVFAPVAAAAAAAAAATAQHVCGLRRRRPHSAGVEGGHVVATTTSEPVWGGRAFMAAALSGAVAPTTTVPSAPTKSPRPSSASMMQRPVSEGAMSLCADQRNMIQRATDEFAVSARGGFVRIFPSECSWELYGSFLEDRNKNNLALHQALYPGTKSSTGGKAFVRRNSSGARVGAGATAARSASAALRSGDTPPLTDELLSRVAQYRRPLVRRTEGAQLSAAAPATSTALTDHVAAVLARAGSGGKDASLSLSDFEDAADDLAAARDDSGRDTDRYTDGVAGQGVGAEREQSKGRTDCRVACPPSSAAAAAQQRRVVAGGVWGGPRPSSAIIAAQTTPAAPAVSVAMVIDDVVARGGSLTPAHARSAFAMYLTRVKERLFAECRGEQSVGDDASAQMGVILRFMRRAAANFDADLPFTVATPSHRLPLPDRQRIMVTQLTEFLRIYGKASERMNATTAGGAQQQPPLSAPLRGADVTRCLCLASEDRLEALLTEYTRAHTGAALFLDRGTDSIAEPLEPSISDHGDGRDDGGGGCAGWRGVAAVSERNVTAVLERGRPPHAQSAPSARPPPPATPTRLTHAPAADAATARTQSPYAVTQRLVGAMATGTQRASSVRPTVATSAAVAPADDMAISHALDRIRQRQAQHLRASTSDVPEVVSQKSRALQASPYGMSNRDIAPTTGRRA